MGRLGTRDEGRLGPDLGERDVRQGKGMGRKGIGTERSERKGRKGEVKRCEARLESKSHAYIIAQASRVGDMGHIGFRAS